MNRKERKTDKESKGKVETMENDERPDSICAAVGFSMRLHARSNNSRRSLSAFCAKDLDMPITEVIPGITDRSRSAKCGTLEIIQRAIEGQRWHAMEKVC
jgi:hypothetical protein